MRKLLAACFWLPFLMQPVYAGAVDAPRMGLFVSMIEDPVVFSSRKEIARLVDFAKRSKIRTLFVQVYRANKSWFPSKVADPSPYNETRKSVGEDPFALLIREAHAEGIKVHAWLNMLSLSANREAPLLKKYGPGILTRNLAPKKLLGDYLIDSQFFLEPGDLRVRGELLNLMGEIVRAYPKLDGVLFDYIRYPDTHPAYGHTEMNVERYKKSTGNPQALDESEAWKAWKRRQVTELLEALVKKTRALRPGIQVAATGCMPYGRALYEAFQEWPKWVNSGLVDFVTVMDYSPDPVEFARWIKAVGPEVTDPKKLKIAVGAYKPLTTPDTFTKELKFCKESGHSDCVIFYYGSVIRNPDLSRVLISEKKMTAAPQARRKP